MNCLYFLPQVIHQYVLAEVQRRCEICFAAAYLSHLLHELDQRAITRQHESVDENSRFAARRNFLECLLQNHRIQSESILVDSAVRQRNRRRFSIGDHYYLPHVLLVRHQESPGEPQALTGIRMVWTDNGSHQLLQRNFFS